jgi:ABC-type Na+ efflux pump permease subunit
MIQRIQSIYLLIATLLSGGLIFFLNLWVSEKGNKFFVMDSFSSSNTLLIVMAVLFFVSSFVTLLSIFQFKKRQLQFVLGRIAILINFILLGIIVYFSQNLSGEINVSEKGIGLLIPVLTIVLVVLANKAIRRDEELVKSVDRLR